MEQMEDTKICLLTRRWTIAEVDLWSSFAHVELGGWLWSLSIYLKIIDAEEDMVL